VRESEETRREETTKHIDIHANKNSKTKDKAGRKKKTAGSEGEMGG
jgi:hypothetical protein